MRQEVNYISHHKNVNLKMIESNLNATHISLYNALFLIWNECGFETELSINRNDVMQLSKIGSANTYTKCLKDLHKMDFLSYKPSFNPLIGSKINLYRFDKGSDNGTDKGSVKGSSKGCDNGCDNSIATLYKLLNKETIKQLNNKTKGQFKEIVNLGYNYFEEEKRKVALKEKESEAELWPTFEDFWDAYDKKRGLKDKVEEKWDRLKQVEKEKIMEYVPNYILTQPDKQFRKDPATFLNNRSWEDELIIPEHLKPKASKFQQIADTHMGAAQRRMKQIELEEQLHYKNK